jgi:hypothetical protein
MPKYLYDGFGNQILAYTQAEVDALKKELAEKTLQLEKLKEETKPKTRRTKLANSPTD